MADAAEDTSKASPENTPLKRWGDKEDDPAEVLSASSSNSEEKAASKLNVEALTINDEESKINKFLDEPQDSNITSVRSLSHGFRYKKVDRFRSLFFVIF
jgi:hypothetical protein